MFSTYMIPADLDLQIYFTNCWSSNYCKDYLGAAYLNGTLMVLCLTLGQGYQIKTTESTGVTVTGDYAMPQTIQLI